MTSPERIRNFVILSHVDHGKSTLADRLLELTGTVEPRKMREQFLDTMPLERERGITIKLQPVRMQYRLKVKNEKLKVGDGGTFNFELFILNLIDTPGHTDFSYEVSRALAAVEGAILLVDATQGIQAQTIANLHLAQRQGLVVIPAVNKIDMPNARVAETEAEVRALEVGFKDADILRLSGKTGQGVPALLEAIVARIPPPSGDAEPGLRALVFDSHFDPYKGIVAYVRVVDGAVRAGDRVTFLGTGAAVESLEVGVFAPELKPTGALEAGEIGYIATGLKEPRLVRVGDTIVQHAKFEIRDAKCIEPLPGYREVLPVVYASFFAARGDEAATVAALRDALEKLRLNDAALVFAPERSSALGRGFRCGFLGLLHLEIVRERIRREYGLDIVVTSPSVAYEVVNTHTGEARTVASAADFPDGVGNLAVREPWVKLEIFAPAAIFGELTKLLRTHRAFVVSTEGFGAERLRVLAEAPLADVIVDFHDQLKSISSGYASLSYELVDWRPADIVKLAILVAGAPVEALALLVPRERAQAVGRSRVEKLKETLPRQLFAVAVQAAIGGTIIARETIPALRKDVTGYLYGGDYSRKKKLLEKQKRGKARLKAGGQMTIPPETFLEMLKTR